MAITMGPGAAHGTACVQPAPDPAPTPFAAFAASLQPQTTLRARITAATREVEPACLPPLIARARQQQGASAATSALASALVAALRRRGRAGGAEGLLDEYGLSSQEGVALMCLAEALLRIPDTPTRDALIRDKIAAGDWQSHVGHSPSMFVNAATWGLVVTGKLTGNSTGRVPGTNSEAGLSAAVSRLIARGGEPPIRQGVAMAMRLMGEQFVTGQSIEEALQRARPVQARGYRFSYDMLGEAATTADDAAGYYAQYQHAIRAIGQASIGSGIYAGNGISIKLSALHPRYSRAQSARVMDELLPRLCALAVLARSFDIGLNIDAEESDRLELSLDLLQALCLDARLSGWHGIGFVVQAYGKRAPAVIDWLIDLARRSNHRLMVRLVKGAYWDSEIKRAQVDGMADFPVLTRKLHTDVSYLACARALLDAPSEIYPQFATHNAQTLAAVYVMAGPHYHPGQYEFQCLHGMGEALYDEVVGASKLDRPCRIYAPVGTHQTLLAYLVRRLLENGANSSFVNRVADASVPIEALTADPVEQAAALQPLGAPADKIALPACLFGTTRENSAGIDLANEQCLAALAAAMLASVAAPSTAAPLLGVTSANGPAHRVDNPADQRDHVGDVHDATLLQVDQAVACAQAATSWGATPAAGRADCLTRAAALLQARMPDLAGPIIREAGKTMPAALSELREAIDFLRYYASQARAFSPVAPAPLGVVVCISPWNFPAAIFTGQVAAALAAGNTVLAKPAEQTPLIAARIVALLHEAGVPREVLQLLPGDGAIGAALVADPRIDGVVFTGSTTVARAIQRRLADRLSPAGRPVVLIAETGGQNAMIVDSSALAEQVVADVLASAFDSAGQRCSALRILCLQDDIAERTLHMLHGAMRELAVSNPGRLSTDIGPVIDAAARDTILAHIERMRARGLRITAAPLPDTTAHGFFVAPTMIEIDHVEDVGAEVFGPVLHVLRYRRQAMPALIDAINATGYGLTFGLHTRIDETIDAVCARVQAGNIYINRNVIGAVVGVQPFGGEFCSGTGPKAGGPLYLHRLVNRLPMQAALRDSAHADPAARLYVDWLRDRGEHALAARCHAYIERAALGAALDLPGPVGERNTYSLHALGRVLCWPATHEGAKLQVGAALATGNHVLLRGSTWSTLPAQVAARIQTVTDWADTEAVLFEGDGPALRTIARIAALGEGPITRLQSVASEPLRAGLDDYQLKWLLKERVITTNTTAAGGNASLMMLE